MATKSTGGKFRYSVRSFKPSLGRYSGQNLYAPTPQLSGVYGLPELAQHMSDHDCALSRSRLRTLKVTTAHPFSEKHAVI